MKKEERNLPKAKDGASDFGLLAAAYSYSGPLPPPSQLKQYDDLVKDGAERIFKMAEKQQNHRLRLESEVIRSDLKQRKRGQKFGLFVAVLALFLSGFLAYLGHDFVAGVISSSTLIGIVSVFVAGQWLEKKE